MSEFGEAIQNPETLGGGLSEQLDHHGTRFESKKMDEQLAFTQDRLSSERKHPTIYDLLDVVHAEREDIKDQKEHSRGDKNKFSSYENELETIRETLLSSMADQDDSITQDAGERVTAYITRQQNRWEVKEESAKTDQERDDAIANKEFFEELQETVFDKRIRDGNIESGLTLANEFADYHTVSGENQDGEIEAKERETYPPYEYKPEKAVEVLEELRKKKPEIDDIRNFYKAVSEDIEKQQIEFGLEHPGWVNKKQAVILAKGFYTQHIKDEGIQNKQILVSILPDGAMHTGWELSAKNPEGTKQYAFSLSEDPHDPYDLGNNGMEVFKFDNRLEKLRDVQNSIDKIANGKKINDTELHRFTCYTDLHRRYIDSKKKQSGKHKQDIKTLKAIAKKVSKHSNGKIENNMED